MSKPSFDITRKQAGMLLVIMVFSYVIGASYELFWTLDYMDYNLHKLGVDEWHPGLIFERNSQHVRYALDKLSLILFDSPKVMPFLASIGLIIVCYYFGRDISGRYLGGIIAALIMSGSTLFRFFDTSGVYENYWVVFYLLSLYVIPKKAWWLSPVFFILSVFSKPLTVLFLPSILFWIYRSELRHKRLLYLVYGVLSAGFFCTSVYLNYFTEYPQFYWAGFTNGLMSWWYFIVADWWMPAAVPAMLMLLLALSFKRVKYADMVLVSMVNVILSGAVLQALAYDIGNQPYRYIPLVALFALSTGVLFHVKRKEKVSQS